MYSAWELGRLHPGSHPSHEGDNFQAPPGPALLPDCCIIVSCHPKRGLGLWPGEFPRPAFNSRSQAQRRWSPTGGPVLAIGGGGSKKSQRTCTSPNWTLGALSRYAVVQYRTTNLKAPPPTPPALACETSTKQAAQAKLEGFPTQIRSSFRVYSCAGSNGLGFQVQPGPAPGPLPSESNSQPPEVHWQVYAWSPGHRGTVRVRSESESDRPTVTGSDHHASLAAMTRTSPRVTVSDRDGPTHGSSSGQSPSRAAASLSLRVLDFRLDLPGRQCESDFKFLPRVPYWQPPEPGSVP
jgi:hypothetical protein